MLDSKYFDSKYFTLFFYISRWVPHSETTPLVSSECILFFVEGYLLGMVGVRFVVLMG